MAAVFGVSCITSPNGEQEKTVKFSTLNQTLQPETGSTIKLRLAFRNFPEKSPVKFPSVPEGEVPANIKEMRSQPLIMFYSMSTNYRGGIGTGTWAKLPWLSMNPRTLLVEYTPFQEPNKVVEFNIANIPAKFLTCAEKPKQSNGGR